MLAATSGAPLTFIESVHTARRGSSPQCSGVAPRCWRAQTPAFPLYDQPLPIARPSAAGDRLPDQPAAREGGGEVREDGRGWEL